MRPRPAFELGLRLAIAFALVAVIAVFCRGPIFRAVLPLFHYEVTRLGDEFRIIGIGLGRSGANHYIYLDAEIARPIVSHGRVLYPEAWNKATAATLSGYILQMIILYGGIVLGWPAARWHSYPLRAALGFPILVLLLAIDVPFVLVATLWRGVVNDLGGEQFSALLIWERFLSYGGRLALALTIAAVTVLAVERISRRLARQAGKIPTA